MFCGFDIGGTKVLGLAIDGPDTVAPSAVRRELTTYDGDALVETIEKMVVALEGDRGQPMTAVGIGVAGIVDRQGTLRYSPNIPGVTDLALKDRLSADLDRVVIVENDATAATWAEVRLGAGQGSDHVALVALGTGIGTGFVFDGRLHHGWNGYAGESGHMVIDHDGPTHLTGARGPWEYFASGSGLGRLAREAVARGELRELVDIAGTSDEIQGEHVHAAIEAGSTEALALLDEFCAFVGLGIANLVHILDFEIAIIAGGLVDIGDPLVQGIERWTHHYVLGGATREQVRVVPAQLGSQAGALGAALLAAEAC